MIMEIFDELYERYPQLKGCEGEIAKAFDLLRLFVHDCGYSFAA